MGYAKSTMTGMTFWTLFRSILLVSLCAHPIVLAVAGLVHFFVNREVGGLFAVLAAPMTLAFFGVPVLAWSLLVIVPTYYALSRLGHRNWVAFAVFAVGASIFVYLFLADPAPSGALPGYEQSAQAMIGVSLVLWACYAHFRMDLVR
jgi:hypothetical protein